MAGRGALLEDVSGLPSLLLTADLEVSLQRVPELAVRHVPCCEQVGVTTLAGDRVETAAHVGEAVPDVDGAQYDSGAGPCLYGLSRGSSSVSCTASSASKPEPSRR